MAKRAPARTTSVFSLGHTKMRATISRRRRALASSTTPTTRANVLRRQPVDDRPVGLAPGEPQHPFAQRGDENRRRLLGANTEAEPADLERVVRRRHLLARECVAEETDDVADLLVRLDERNAVPPLDDDVARRADADGEPPGAASASEATHWARQAGARVYAGTIAVPRRSRGSHAAARASGVNASALSASADHTSV